MVLSNKKLKQKFRSLLSKSLASSDSKKPHGDAAGGDVNRQLESMKELLRSKSKKPRTNKAKGRRKKPPSSEESKPIGKNEETQIKNGENGEPTGLNKEKKRKKRKRERDGEEGSAENEQKKNNQKKKKDKKKYKKKKKKGKEEKDKEEDKKEEGKDEKGNKSVNGGSEEKGVAESINNEESEQNAKKVYVGGIPYYSTEDDIRSFFEVCGTVTEVDCMRFPESGKFRGIAFLTFKTEAAAKRALALDGADMGGFYLKIQPYKANSTQKSDFSPEIVDGYNRIYVGNLSWDITEDDLRHLFSDCQVSSIKWGMDKETGDFKGYAHVDFADSVSLAVALKLDQNVVCGRPVRIRCAVPKKEGEGKKSLEPSGKKAEVGKTDGNPKKKRRTCYECGVPGHLSSSCPQKRAVEADGSGAKS